MKLDGYQIVSEMVLFIQESKLSKHLMTMSDKSLSRLSPAAVRSRSGMRAHHVDNRGRLLYPLFKSRDSEVKHHVRTSLKKLPKDRLSTREPGRIQRDAENRAAGFQSAFLPNKD